VYSSISQITNVAQRALQSVHIRHPWPLTFHIESEKTPKKYFLKTFTGKKKWRTLQESNRGGPLSRMDRTIDVMWPEGIITELHKHIQWVWQSVWIVGRRHGPRSRPPWSMRQMEVERRSGRGISSVPARSNGPYETWSHRDSMGGSITSNVWWRDENSSLRRERRGERCSVYPNTPPSSIQVYSSLFSWFLHWVFPHVCLIVKSPKKLKAKCVIYDMKHKLT